MPTIRGLWRIRTVAFAAGIAVASVTTLAASDSQDGDVGEYASVVAARIRALHLKTFDSSPEKAHELMLVQAISDVPTLAQFARSTRERVHGPACAAIGDLVSTLHTTNHDSAEVARLRLKLAQVLAETRELATMCKR